MVIGLYRVHLKYCRYDLIADILHLFSPALICRRKSTVSSNVWAPVCCKKRVRIAVEQRQTLPQTCHSNAFVVNRVRFPQIFCGKLSHTEVIIRNRHHSAMCHAYDFNDFTHV